MDLEALLEEKSSITDRGLLHLLERFFEPFAQLEFLVFDESMKALEGAETPAMEAAIQNMFSEGHKARSDGNTRYALIEIHFQGRLEGYTAIFCQNAELLPLPFDLFLNWSKDLIFRELISQEQTLLLEEQNIRQSHLVNQIDNLKLEFHQISIENLQYHQKMQETNLRLEKIKTSFLSQISHEMRTPMNGILAMADLLSRSGLNPEQAEHLKLLLSSSQNMMQLIDQLLDIKEDPTQGPENLIRPLFEIDLQKKASILVVEDNPMNQQVIKKLLDSLELNFTLAENGEDGLSLALSRHYDLILMDIMLPSMDGIETCQRLRRAGISCPVVGLSASTESSTKNKALKNGMNEFMYKPLRLAEFGQMLSRMLQVFSGETVEYSLACLIDTMNVEPDFVPSMLETFLLSFEQEMNQLKEALDKGSLMEGKHLAHSMLNSAKLLCLTPYVEDLKEIETTEDRQRILNLAGRLYKFWPGLKLRLQEHLQFLKS